MTTYTVSAIEKRITYWGAEMDITTSSALEAMKIFLDNDRNGYLDWEDTSVSDPETEFETCVITVKEDE